MRRVTPSRELRRPSATRSVTCSRSATASSRRTGSRRRRPPTFVTGSGRCSTRRPARRATHSTVAGSPRTETMEASGSWFGSRSMVRQTPSRRSGSRTTAASCRTARFSASPPKVASRSPGRTWMGRTRTGRRTSCTADVFARRSGLRPAGAGHDARTAPGAADRRDGPARGRPRGHDPRDGRPGRRERRRDLGPAEPGRRPAHRCEGARPLRLEGEPADCRAAGRRRVPRRHRHHVVSSSRPGLHAEAGGLPTGTRRWIA